MMKRIYQNRTRCHKTASGISGILVTLFLTACFIFAAKPLWGQEDYRVHRLEFEGNHTLSDAQLRSKMTTHAVGWVKRILPGTKPFLFSRTILDKDLIRLVRYYQREGFLYAKAETEQIKIDHDARTLRIFIKIIEGDPITVDRVRMKRPDSLPEPNPAVQNLIGRLANMADNLTGMRFRDQSVQATRDEMLNLMENYGFPYADIDPNLTVDEDKRTVAINWVLTPGPQGRFGQVKIEGNDYVSTELIRRSLTFRPGEIYDRRELEASQRYLYDLSLFHVVTVTAELSASMDTLIPVRVQVKEAPRYSTRVGFGYGREEKFRVYSDSRVLDFFGGARRLNLYMRHSDLEPYNVSLKLTQPDFFDRRNIMETRPFIVRQEEPGFTVNRYGGSVAIMRRLMQSIHGSVTYSLERINLDTTSLADLAGEEEIIEDYNKSSVLFGITADNSRPIFSPQRGFYGASLFKISGLGLGSDYHFTRFLLDLRRYQSFWGMVMAFRVKFGGIKSTDRHGFIPVEDRFFSGGSASVRGWARSTLGPLKDGKPIGGKSLVEAGIECRFPIIGIFSGAVFSDLGNVWQPSYTYHLDELRYSAGIGLRVRTPIGPIRLDAAQPVADEETTVQVHLSVGEAF